MANDDDKKAAEAYASFKEKYSQDGERFTKEDYARGVGISTNDHKRKGFLAGIAYLREQLMKGAPEFDLPKNISYDGISSILENKKRRIENGKGADSVKCMLQHAFANGARWQHEQSRLRDGALQDANVTLAVDCAFAERERDAALAEVEHLKRQYAEAVSGCCDCPMFKSAHAEGDRLKRDLAEANEALGDFDKLVRENQKFRDELAEERARALKAQPYYFDEWTAECARAEKLVEALEKIGSRFAPGLQQTFDVICQNQMEAHDALAAYKETK